MLPGFLLIFSAASGRILYVSNNVSTELGHPVVSDVTPTSTFHVADQIENGMHTN